MFLICDYEIPQFCKSKIHLELKREGDKEGKEKIAKSFPIRLLLRFSEASDSYQYLSRANLQINIAYRIFASESLQSVTSS